MKNSLVSNKTAPAEEARLGSAADLGVSARVVCFLLLVTIAVFATLGNRPRQIVQTHADHDSGPAQNSFHLSDDHEDDHHDDHPPAEEQDGGGQSDHHHHVEISPSLMIAMVMLVENKVFHISSSLSVSIPDEICPPSPFCEIVKPPQVA